MYEWVPNSREYKMEWKKHWELVVFSLLLKYILYIRGCIATKALRNIHKTTFNIVSYFSGEKNRMGRILSVMLLPIEQDLGNMNLKMLEMRNDRKDLHVRLVLYYCCPALHTCVCYFAFFPADTEVSDRGTIPASFRSMAKHPGLPHLKADAYSERGCLCFLCPSGNIMSDFKSQCFLGFLYAPPGKPAKTISKSSYFLPFGCFPSPSAILAQLNTTKLPFHPKSNHLSVNHI